MESQCVCPFVLQRTNTPTDADSWTDVICGGVQEKTFILGPEQEFFRLRAIGAQPEFNKPRLTDLLPNR